VGEKAIEPESVRRRVSSIAAARYPALSGYASITRGVAWMCLLGCVLIGIATTMNSDNRNVVESLVALLLSAGIGYGLFIVIGASGDFAKAVMDIAALGMDSAERDHVIHR
jgi:hypothetical protein